MTGVVTKGLKGRVRQEKGGKVDDPITGGGLAWTTPSKEGKIGPCPFGGRGGGGKPFQKKANVSLGRNLQL